MIIKQVINARGTTVVAHPLSKGDLVSGQQSGTFAVVRAGEKPGFLLYVDGELRASSVCPERYKLPQPISHERPLAPMLAQPLNGDTEVVATEDCVTIKTSRNTRVTCADSSLVLVENVGGEAVQVTVPDGMVSHRAESISEVRLPPGERVLIYRYRYGYHLYGRWHALYVAL